MDQPAARNPGVFKTDELMFMSRSATPSFALARYDVRRYHIAKLFA